MSKLKNYKKISIIGGPGTGKTTLSNNLSNKLENPVYHIDGIHYLDDWVVRDKNQRDKEVKKIILKDKWVIDGTYKDTLEDRIKAADLIIFLNYSSIAKIKGILTRYIKQRGKEKKEIPGCKEKMDFEFIRLTMKWNKTKGKFVLDLLDKYKDKDILIFKNRRKLNKWYEKNFNCKIEL